MPMDLIIPRRSSYCPNFATAPLYLHTEVPDDPVKIARDQRWGQDALSTATDLITHNTTATTNDIGAPAEYDTAIDTSYQHNLGIQKGWIK